MNGWQIQAMYERDTEALWERISAPDPAEKQMQNASVGMGDASYLMDMAEERMLSAVRYLRNTPMEDKVNDLINALDDLRVEIRSLADKYRKGVRE